MKNFKKINKNKNNHKRGNQITNYFIHRCGQKGSKCYVLERLRNRSEINLLVNPFQFCVLVGGYFSLAGVIFLTD